MKRWMIGVSVFLIIAGALTGCSANSGADGVRDPNKLQVFVSLYPLQYFTEQIGGNHVQVTNLVPPGVEPHDFEVSAHDMVNLSNADVFVYNGAGLESWADRVIPELDPKTIVVNSSKHLTLLPATEEEDGKKAAFDPHIWLDPVNAKQQALNIRDALIRKDPTHRADYEKGYQALAAKLDQLDHEYAEMAKRATQRDFVTSHAAFAYLAKQYQLVQIPVTGISPEMEPSPQQLQTIIETVKHHHVKYVMFETLVNNKVADVVRNEVGATELVMNPLEGLTPAEITHGDNYFTVMEQNKTNLAKALGVTP